MKKIVNTDKAPRAIGPYSQAVRADNFLFISGQLPMDPVTMEMVGETAAEQARAALNNIGAILNAAGMDFGDMVKTTVLLKNIADFQAVNEVYASFFSGDYPARAAYEVVNLPKNALVEIEGVAWKRS